MGSSMNAKLQYKDRNLAGASYVDLGAFFKFAKPWLRYAIEMDKGDINAPLSDASEEIPSPTGKDVLDLFKPLKASAKYGRPPNSMEREPKPIGDSRSNGS